MEKFDASNREHKIIVQAAMCAADALGVGRITAAREQLELNDIHVTDMDVFQRAVLEWGKSI